MRVDIRCRKEKKREGQVESYPVDFTAMINRHRLLIVLDLDGGAAGQPGLVFRAAQRVPASLIHLAAKDTGDMYWFQVPLIRLLDFFLFIHTFVSFD